MVTISSVLKIQNPPGEEHEGAQIYEQLLTDLSRDILRTRIQDTLRKGMACAPNIATGKSNVMVQL
jgi:hypothetical protein